jgi:hypothetical protein
MKSVHIKMGEDGKPVLPRGGANLARIDATTEQDIVRHAKLDDETYRHLRECELEAALAESRADLDAGRFVNEAVTAHIKKIKHLSQ